MTPYRKWKWCTGQMAKATGVCAVRLPKRQNCKSQHMPRMTQRRHCNMLFVCVQPSHACLKQPGRDTAVGS
jgi:hypothetical protein